MIKDNDRISSWQTAVILVSAMTATEILKMPRILGQQVGPDGWVSLIIGHALALLMVMLIIALGRRFAGSTFIEYSQQILGRIPGSLLGLTAVAFWITISARILRVFSDIMKLFVLPRTPLEMIIIMSLVLSLYLVRHGVEPLARTLEISFYLMIAVVGAIILLSVPNMDLTNLQPVFGAGTRAILVSGVQQGISRLRGIEVFLMLLPFMLVQQRAVKAAAIGLGFSLAIGLSLFTVTISVFGEHAIDLAWPVALLAQYAVIPGSFVEHLEISFLLIWITVAFTSMVVYSYLACLGLCRLLKLSEPSIVTFPLLPVIYFISLLPASVFATEKMEILDGQLHTVVAWIFPSLLLLVAWLRRLGGQRTEAGAN